MLVINLRSSAWSSITRSLAVGARVSLQHCRWERLVQFNLAPSLRARRWRQFKCVKTPQRHSEAAAAARRRHTAGANYACTHLQRPYVCVFAREWHARTLSYCWEGRAFPLRRRRQPLLVIQTANLLTQRAAGLMQDTLTSLRKFANGARWWWWI